MISRRGFLGGLAAALAAPAIIRTPGLLMPVRPLRVASEHLGDALPYLGVEHVEWYGVRVSHLWPRAAILDLPGARLVLGKMAFEAGVFGSSVARIPA